MSQTSSWPMNDRQPRSKAGEEIMRIFQELNEQRASRSCSSPMSGHRRAHATHRAPGDGLIVSDAPVAVTRRAAMPVAAGSKQSVAQRRSSGQPSASRNGGGRSRKIGEAVMKKIIRWALGC